MSLIEGFAVLVIKNGDQKVSPDTARRNRGHRTPRSWRDINETIGRPRHDTLTKIKAIPKLI